METLKKSIKQNESNDFKCIGKARPGEGKLSMNKATGCMYKKDDVSITETQM